MLPAGPQEGQRPSWTQKLQAQERGTTFGLGARNLTTQPALHGLHPNTLTRVWCKLAGLLSSELAGTGRAGVRGGLCAARAALSASTPEVREHTASACPTPSAASAAHTFLPRGQEPVTNRNTVHVHNSSQLY